MAVGAGALAISFVQFGEWESALLREWLMPLATGLALIAGLAAFYGANRLSVRANESLRSFSGHLQAVIAIAPDAVVIFDRSGRIDFFSAAAEQMFRLTLREAREKQVSSLFTRSGRSELAAAMEECRGGERRRPFAVARDISAIRNDGTRIPVAIQLGEISIGGNVRFVAFVRDLSGSKAIEYRVDRLQTEVTHLSRLVTMGDMAPALAHELNQPLTALSAYLQGAMHLLAERKDDTTVLAVDAMTRAASQVGRAADVIRRLREFVVRGETEKRVESLARMIEETMALVAVVQRGRPLDIGLRLKSGADLVVANRIQIQQVLLNLIRNGLEAMNDQPERRLVISSERAAGDMICVSIADRGTGIEPEVAARLFQPFVTSKRHGLGVGLSISRTIVEAHGGRITTAPNPGGGTIFQFTLRSGAFKDEGCDNLG